MSQFLDLAPEKSYDVIIVGGAIMGCATAWFLSVDKRFDGRILVVEQDPSYQFSSTAHTNSCIRQQFSTPLNIKISQYCAEYIQNLHENLGYDDRIKDVRINNFGYLYLAQNKSGADILKENHDLQKQLGVATVLMPPDELKRRFPFIYVDDIVLASLNTKDEGFWDAGYVFDWWRRKSHENGVTFVNARMIDMSRDKSTGCVNSVLLSNGQSLATSYVVNAAGTRCSQICQDAGCDMPVEARKRYTWVIKTESPLQTPLPLTVDPSGVHIRQDGRDTYMIGSAGQSDHAVSATDFVSDVDLWIDHVWPKVFKRIPQFDRVKIMNEWVGHYAYNTFDQNAIVGPHPQCDNLLLVNGFSGHGLQQAPAMGRGISEWIVTKTYETLDLRPFHYERILKNTPIIERAII